MNNKVIIFDTTLRDGEQSLNSCLNLNKKLQIALALERLGVDIIEAGFPVSSPGDFESVQLIAKNIKNSTICALSRAVEKDIEVAAKALQSAEHFRIHTFISTSTIHVQDKLRKKYDEVINMGINAIKCALKFTDDVEFSCEDAGRTPIDDLCRMVEAAITAGARTINIPDTVGYTLPTEFKGIIENLFDRVPNIDKAIISVHCHDDLGMSVANSISAIEAGARQVEGTINGLGERAGNCALEEIAMILHTRKEKIGLDTNINLQEIHRTSKLVSNICNAPVQANKAIVGSNAFNHSSGIHQDGMIKNKNTYEIMTPKSIGLEETTLTLTSRSGRAAVQHRMEKMGYNKEQYSLDNLYESFLSLADKKGQIFDYDLEALVYLSSLALEKEYYTLEYLSVQSGNTVMATASVKLSFDGESHAEAAIGNGPIDAVYQCISRLTGYPIQMEYFEVKSKSEGKDALGQVDISIKHNNRYFHGIGLATDIIESATHALLHALNSIHQAEEVEKEKEKLSQKDT